MLRGDRTVAMTKDVARGRSDLSQGTMPEQYVASYKESYNKAANRLIREFSNSFCKEDGSIDWEKLVEFNSGD